MDPTLAAAAAADRSARHPDPSGAPPHPAAASAPPGWYPDPSGARLLRFFDGQQWTDRTGPAPVSGGTLGDDPRDPMHWLVPTGRTWQSIASGYAGLVSLAIWPLGPVAVGLGALALRKSASTGLHGRGRAIFGIASGSLATLALIAFILS